MAKLTKRTVDAAAAEARDRFLYMPFGGGPRICVGANFAMMQAQIILATLLARFRFEPGPDPVPSPTMSMTVRSDGGVRLVVKPTDQQRPTRRSPN